MVQSISTLPIALAERLNASQVDIDAFCQRWHITELGIFGSAIRNDFGADSDIDVLIVFDPDIQQDVFARDHAQAELAERFGRDVDLTGKILLKNPFSRAEILQTYRVVYPAERANFTGLLAADQRMTDNVRNNAALLTMIDSMQALREFTQDKTFENYLSDRFLRRVVERELETVGEAANRLISDFQAKHSDIDWRGVVGLRNAIIHQYDELDYERIWEIATVRVPMPIEKIEPLLSPLPEDLPCTHKSESPRIGELQGLPTHPVATRHPSRGDFYRLGRLNCRNGSPLHLLSPLPEDLPCTHKSESLRIGELQGLPTHPVATRHPSRGDFYRLGRLNCRNGSPLHHSLK